MTENIRDLISYVAHSLNQKPPPESSLNALPQYASIDIGQASTLVVAQCHDEYIFSIVKESRVLSFITSLTESKTSLLSRCEELQKQLESDDNLDRSGPSISTQSKEAQPFPSSTSATSSESRLRDPNAPPGFEFETFPSHNPVPDIRPSFNPDEDLYPPGGRYPIMSPMGGPGIGPFHPSHPGGMHPDPIGSARPPRIKYDPTSPFPNSGAGSSFGPHF